jgi:hypothetical protein
MTVPWTTGRPSRKNIERLAQAVARAEARQHLPEKRVAVAQKLEQQQAATPTAPQKMHPQLLQVARQRRQAAQENAMYERYEAGLQKLHELIPHHHRRYAEALAYETRLRADLERCKQCHNNPDARKDLAEVIARLNALTLHVTKGQHCFNDLWTAKD